MTGPGTCLMVTFARSSGAIFASKATGTMDSGQLVMTGEALDSTIHARTRHFFDRLGNFAAVFP